MPGKKGGKSGGKQTVSLDEFLANSNAGPEAVNAISLAPPAANITDQGSWADAPFDLRTPSDKPSWERRDTSPSRNQRGGGINLGEGPDFSKVPDEPPFKAFVTNVSYNAQREDLKEHFGGRDEIRSIYMIQNDQGNFKGSANIEFATREGLISALHLHASSMLGRQIRVEVSTSQGRSRNTDGYGSNRGGDFDRSERGGGYNPVANEISDDSWTRGQDFQRQSSNTADDSAPTDRYVPPNRRRDYNPSSSSSTNHNNSSSSIYRPPNSSANYSNDRYSNDSRDNRGNNRYDSQRNNYDRDFRSNDRDRGYDNSRRNENRYDNYDSSRRGPGLSDDPRRQHNSGDDSGRYYDGGQRTRNGDSYSSGYDGRGPARRERGDSYRSDYDQESRRDDRYYDERDRPPPRDRDPEYRDASPRRQPAENGMNRSLDYSEESSRYRDQRGGTEDDYYNRSSDNHESGVTSRGNQESSDRRNDHLTPPYNSNSESYTYPERNRTYSQRSGDSYGDGQQRYTLENDNRSRNGGGYNDYEGDRYSNSNRTRYGEPDKDREYERRYERYQNDIAPRADDRSGGGGGGGYDNRRRTDSGSGSGVGGYDNRRNDSGRGQGGYRSGGDYNNRGDRDGRGGGYNSSGGGFSRGNDRSYNDRGGNRGYESRGGGGGYNRRDDYYEGRDRRGGGPYSPNKSYNNEDSRYDSYGRNESSRSERPKLELLPRGSTVPSERREAENRPSSIFGAAKPVDTSQREKEILARRAKAEKLQVDIGKDASKRPGATGGGGGNVYRPPHRSNNQQQQQQPHSNSSGGGQSAYTSDQPMSPESVLNKFAVLNADDDDDYHS